MSNLKLLQDGGTVVGHGDLFARLLVSHGLQDLVHALGAQGRLHQVRDGDRTDERLLYREAMLVSSRNNLNWSECSCAVES